MGFMEKLQSRLELFRLEQRYTRRKNRTTFVSEAQYVNGEYVYTVPSSSKSSSSSGLGSIGKNAGVRIRELTRVPLTGSG
ncbi:MAG: hypothetical protein M1812_000897 [Candelaria pacifica]|nr:MAG: hypothetical protein M1812_000897 [Candelaria pacifica]